VEAVKQIITFTPCFQSIQAAVDHQLTTLARDNPSQRVAVVTFGDEVGYPLYDVHSLAIG